MRGEDCLCLLRLGTFWFWSEAQGVFSLHFLEILGSWGASELAVVDFLEGVDVRAEGFFIHHQRDAFVPPLVKGIGERCDNFGVVRSDVIFLGIVGREIEEFPCGFCAAFFADERPACVTDGGCLELVIVWLC